MFHVKNILYIEILLKKVKPYFINKLLTEQIYYSDSRK